MMRRLPPFDYDILNGLVGRHGLQNVLNALADISREMQWLNTAAVLDETAMEVPPKHEAKRNRRRKAVACIVLAVVAATLAMPAQAQSVPPPVPRYNCYLTPAQQQQLMALGIQAYNNGNASALMMENTFVEAWHQRCEAAYQRAMLTWQAEMQRWQLMNR